MPMAAHGAIVCASHCLGDTRAIRDVPHAWHACVPGFTSVPQDGQFDMIGVAQFEQKLPAAA
jgi:hypothetical protein